MDFRSPYLWAQVLVFLGMLPFVWMDSTQDVLIIANGGDLTAALAKGNKVFVKFYSPKCGFCSKMAPAWESLAKELNPEGKITIAKIDCITIDGGDLCHEFGVKGYPTLKLLENDKIAEYPENGGRDEIALKEWVTKTKPSEQLPKFAEKKQPNTWSSSSDVIAINETNYEQILKGDWLLEFYADWCGFCQKFIPEYEGIATQLKGKVNVAKINLNEGHSLPEAFLVKNIPTVKFLKESKVYTIKARTASEIISFTQNGYKESESAEIPNIVLQPIVELDETPRDQYFTGQESVMGIAAALLLFGLGFVVGRITSPSPKRIIKKTTRIKPNHLEYLKS